MVATIGFFKADATHRLQVLAKARPRTQWRPSQGDWVMLHRNNGLHRWKEGPCSVIQVSGTSCWIVNKTSLLKVSNTNVRKATNDEKDGVELINRYLPTLREELLQRRRRREYWDLTHEQPLPPEAGDEEEALPRQESAAAESQESTEAPPATEQEIRGGGSLGECLRRRGTDGREKTC